MEKLIEALIECGVASRARDGESQCGDESLIECFKGGVLLAVVDGLGHGSEAARAARLAIQVLRQHSAESVVELTRHCHRSLQCSRGVVMSLARFNAADSSLTWIGLGNVKGMLLRADPSSAPTRETLLLRGGVVGGNLPSLRASVVSISGGDVLIFSSDGIADDFYGEVTLSDPVQEIADCILDKHKREIDDGIVLVARFLAETP